MPIKPKQLTKKEKEAFSVSPELEDILIGLLLGDLYGEKRNVNVRFRFAQGTVHEEYLLYLYVLFKDFCSAGPTNVNPMPDKRTGRVYSAIYFRTYTLPCFVPLHDDFYLAGKKIVPDNIAELLTPLGLAYWICDDGCFCKTNRVVDLSTESFTLKEVNLLINVLESKFNLNAPLTKMGPVLKYEFQLNQCRFYNPC